MPLISGGGQERGQRAGTENVAAHRRLRRSRGSASRKQLDEAARMAGAARPAGSGHHGGGAAGGDLRRGRPRLPNTTLFAVPGMKAETAVIAFDLEGIAVSSGSACSSGKVQPSPCACGDGRGSRACGGAVRVSLGWRTTEARYRSF